jgi:hypothetical protein
MEIFYVCTNVDLLAFDGTVPSLVAKFWPVCAAPSLSHRPGNNKKHFSYPSHLEL